MAATAGFSGSVVLSGLTVGIKTWIVNAVADVGEITTLASGQDREFKALLKSWTGSFEGNWEDGNTIQVGDSGSATFYAGAGTGQGFEGHIIITGYDIENAFDGIVNAPITFQGSGPPPTL